MTFQLLHMEAAVALEQSEKFLWTDPKDIPIGVLLSSDRIERLVYGRDYGVLPVYMNRAQGWDFVFVAAQWDAREDLRLESSFMAMTREGQWSPLLKGIISGGTLVSGWARPLDAEVAVSSVGLDPDFQTKLNDALLRRYGRGAV